MPLIGSRELPTDILWKTSVYIASDYQKKGIGKKIYSHLIEELKTLGFKTLLAGISLPNKGSVLFHENLGFRRVGQLEKSRI